MEGCNDLIEVLQQPDNNNNNNNNKRISLNVTYGYKNYKVTLQKQRLYTVNNKCFSSCSAVCGLWYHRQCLLSNMTCQPTSIVQTHWRSDVPTRWVNTEQPHLHYTPTDVLTYPCAGWTATARGLSMSFQIITLRINPSRLDTSILDVPESVQNNLSCTQSTATPPTHHTPNSFTSVESGNSEVSEEVKFYATLDISSVMSEMSLSRQKQTGKIQEKHKS